MKGVGYGLPKEMTVKHNQIFLQRFKSPTSVQKGLKSRLSGYSSPKFVNSLMGSRKNSQKSLCKQPSRCSLANIAKKTEGSISERSRNTADFEEANKENFQILSNVCNETENKHKDQSKTISNTHNRTTSNSDFHIRTFIRFKPEKNACKNTQQNKGQHLRVQSKFQQKIAVIDGNQILCQDNFFSFDHVFEAESKQSDIYQNVSQQMVEHFVRGFNSTIFTYGQTGSGKTYTMFGNSSEKNLEENKQNLRSKTKAQIQDGIIPQAIHDIFDSVHQKIQSGYIQEGTVSCSMLEIYKENLIDLLSNQKLELKIKQNKIYNVTNLNIRDVQSKEELLKTLQIGNEFKKIRETCMNEVSSRSHVIFTIYLQVRKEGQKRLSKFNFVDLAGSQKVFKSKVQGQGLEQAKKINLSLSCLGNTINALLKRNDHIPYRESKLTRLLYESLGGNSLTRLIVTCSSENSEIQQTISSLKFASRAKNLKTNPLINTLRKSQKSVSRIAYENLRKKYIENEHKIKRIAQLTTKTKAKIICFKDESTKFNLQNQIDKALQLLNTTVKLICKIMQESIQNELIHKNDTSAVTVQLPQVLNPFQLISQHHEQQVVPLTQKDRFKKIFDSQSVNSRQKNISCSTISLKQKDVEKMNQLPDSYWQIIKRQERQIMTLKNKIRQLQLNTSLSSGKNYQESCQNLFSKEKFSAKKTCSIDQLISLKLHDTNGQQPIRMNRKSQPKRLKIKTSKSAHSPTLNIINDKTLKNNKQINLSITNQNSIQRNHFKSIQQKANSRNNSNFSIRQPQQSQGQAVNEFLPNSNDQQSQLHFLKEIHKLLETRNQKEGYEAFEKQILLKQLDILLQRKIDDSLDQINDNRVNSKKALNKNSDEFCQQTFCDTQKLLISQVKYIHNLEGILSTSLNKFMENQQKDKLNFIL